MYTLPGVIDQVNINSVETSQIFSLALKTAGPTLFLTFICSLGAFLVALLAEIEAIRSFLAYGIVALLFNFIYGMTVLLAYLAMDTRRQKNLKSDWCGGIKCGANSCIFCRGKIKNYERFDRQEKNQFHPVNKSSSKTIPIDKEAPE